MDWQIAFQASDNEYHAYNQRLKEKFIHNLDDEAIIGDMLGKLTTIKDINEATSDQILIWAQTLAAQTVQKEVLDNIREAKEFDSIR